MLVYEPAADRWSSPGEIPEGVNHAGFVYLDGRLYIIGGYREASFEATDTVHIHDTASGTWQRGAPPLPTPRGALTRAVVDGKIHALGGRAGQDSLTTHEVYDPARKMPIYSSFPRTRESSALFCLGSRSPLNARGDRLRGSDAID